MRNFFLPVCVAVLLFGGCRNASQNAGEDSQIVIATLKGPSSMGMIQFIDSISTSALSQIKSSHSQIKSAHSQIKIDILNEPMQVRKMMLDGSADFAILPTTMAALMYNKGVDYRLMAIPVWGSLYLVGKDSTITGWAHLRNKRINVMGRGMTPDVLFRYLLEKNGINPETDVVLDYSFPTHIDLANAVAAGIADMGVVSEPFATLVLDKNRDVRTLFDLNLELDKLQRVAMAQTAFVVRESFLRRHPQKVKQILSAYQRSSLWVNQNLDSAATLIVKYDILPEHGLALRSIPRSNILFVPAAGIRDGVDRYLRIFYDINPDIIGGKMPDENFIN